MEGKSSNRYFSRCNSCGYLNELKDETTIFCHNCGKKLKDNYHDWSAVNPEKSFDDFKLEVCVLDEQPIEDLAKQKRLLSKSIRWFLLGLIAIFLIVLAYFFSHKADSVILDKNFQKPIPKQEWIKKQYGKTGLQLQTPVKLAPFKLNLSSASSSLLKSVESFQYESNDGFTIFAFSAQYKPQFGVLELKNTINGTIDEIMLQQGASNFEFSAGTLTRSGIVGAFQRGTFVKNGVSYEFINVVFTKDLKFWQVLVYFKPNDKFGQESVDRIINSIEIKN